MMRKLTFSIVGNRREMFLFPLEFDLIFSFNFYFMVHISRPR